MTSLLCAELIKLRSVRMGVWLLLTALGLVVLLVLVTVPPAGVAFRSATEPIDTLTATGRMLVQLLGVFAEFERATIIHRVVAGKERKAARGGWPGGTRPYGIRLDADGRLTREPAEFPVVERIFTRYAVHRLRSCSPSWHWKSFPPLPLPPHPAIVILLIAALEL